MHSMHCSSVWCGGGRLWWCFTVVCNLPSRLDCIVSLCALFVMCVLIDEISPHHPPRQPTDRQSPANRTSATPAPNLRPGRRQAVGDLLEARLQALEAEVAGLRVLVTQVKLPEGLSGPMRAFWLDRFNADTVSLEVFVDAVGSGRPGGRAGGWRWAQGMVRACGRGVAVAWGRAAAWPVGDRHPRMLHTSPTPTVAPAVGCAGPPRFHGWSGPPPGRFTGPHGVQVPVRGWACGPGGRAGRGRQGQAGTGRWL
jgi:hypothetical protein